MSFKQPTIAVAVAALVAVAGSATVSAQENCTFMYQRVMEAYQTQAPYYSQMLNQYNARCLSGSSAVPYQTPYTYQPYAYQPYTYQTPYAYQQPVDPAAAFLGGVAGGVVAEALEGDHSRHYGYDRGRRGW